MKKLVYLVALAAFAAGSSLFAQQSDEPAAAPVINGGKGGFVAPPRVYQVRDVQELPDDTKVVFTGFISEQVGDDKYMFNGVTILPSGSWTWSDDNKIVIEIDEDKWQGQTITPKDIIRIEGEVDKDDDGVKIEVRRLTKVGLEAERGQNMTKAERDRIRGKLVRLNQDEQRQMQESRVRVPARQVACPNCGHVFMPILPRGAAPDAAPAQP